MYVRVSDRERAVRRHECTARERGSARPACIKYYWYGHPQKIPLGRLILLLCRLCIVGALTDRVIRNFSSNERSSAVRESVPLREMREIMYVRVSDRERAVRRHECTAREREVRAREQCMSAAVNRGELEIVLPVDNEILGKCTYIRKKQDGVSSSPRSSPPPVPPPATR